MLLADGVGSEINVNNEVRTTRKDLFLNVKK